MNVCTQTNHQSDWTLNDLIKLLLYRVTAVYVSIIQSINIYDFVGIAKRQADFEQKQLSA